MREKVWPSIWKVETIVAIPKTLSPGSFDELRPISMTTLWSKILETMIAEYTLAETFDNWNKTQHGGRKGSSTDHVLIDM